jgi:gluconokinase
LIIILFGLPGAGKSMAGGLLRDEHGFHFHEADDDIPADYRARVARGEVVSDAMRDDYHRALLDRLDELQAQHPRLAVAAPLLRDKHRRWIAERFPAALFVRVTCDPAVWVARLAARPDHAISLDYARRVRALDEPPSIPHQMLDNSGDGADALRRALLRVLATAP